MNLAGLLTCFLLVHLPSLSTSGIEENNNSINEIPKHVRYKLTVAGTVLDLTIRISPDSLLIHSLNKWNQNSLQK